MYTVSDTTYERHGILEIDRATYERWKNTFCEFENVQEEIVEAMKDAGHSTWGDGDTATFWDNDA